MTDRISPDMFIDPDPIDPHNYAPVADDEDIRCIWCDTRPSSLADGPCPGPGGPTLDTPNHRDGCDACHRGTIIGIIDSRIGEEEIMPAGFADASGWWPVERCDNCGIWTDDKQAAWALGEVDVIEADFLIRSPECRWCGTPRHADDHAGCSRCGNAWPDDEYVTQMYVRPLSSHDGRFFSEGGDTDPLTD